MAVSIFAFYGRVSTEDQQDPASSRTWQLTGSQSLIRGFTAVVIGEPARAFYGNQFSLTFPLFVHYGIQLWGCRKWEAQSILRWMLTAPQPGQSCHECASIDYATAEGLTRDRIVCPSAADPGRNRHRSGIAWSKSAIRVILANPRYTGHQVWNRQRRDEVLIDVDDVALGHQTELRWNPDHDGIWSPPRPISP